MLWAVRLRHEGVLGLLVGTGTLIGGLAGLLQDRPTIAVGLWMITAVVTGGVVLRQERRPNTRLPSPVRPANSPDTAACNVPSPTLTFVGRDRDLDELRAMLRAVPAGVAVAALHGLGGVGKTQLALLYAQRYPGTTVTWQLTLLAASTCLTGSAVSLGRSLGLPDVDDVARAAQLALIELGRRRDWLLIYDDVTVPEDLDGLLPVAGGGRVLITSRHADWRGATEAMTLAPLDAPTSVDFLLRRVASERDEVAARALAQRLGGLPLALEQAAAYCTTAGIPLADYLRRFDATPVRLLGEGQPYDHRDSVARTWLLSLAEAERRNHAAADLLILLAHVAPAPLPRWVLTATPRDLTRSFQRTLRDDVRLDAAIRTLTSLSLLTVRPNGLQVHALVQQVVRDHVAQRARWKGGRRRLPIRLNGAVCVSALVPMLWASFPGEFSPKERERCAALRPHIETVLDHAFRLRTNGAWSCALAVWMLRFLVDRVEFDSAAILVRRAWQVSQQVLGNTHSRTLSLADNHAFVQRAMGNLEGALSGHLSALISLRRVLGPDHNYSIMSANNYAEALRAVGDLPAAQRLHEETLARCVRVVGEHDGETAGSMNNLALTLRDIGDLAGARALLERARSVSGRRLGPTHPNTLTSANNLADVMCLMGHTHDARKLHQETLDIRRVTRGDYHLDTLGSMNNLACTIHQLGDSTEARRLLEDTVEVCKMILGSNHPRTSTAVANLDSLLSDMGELEKAHLDASLPQSRSGERIQTLSSCLTSVWSVIYRPADGD